MLRIHEHNWCHREVQNSVIENVVNIVILLCALRQKKGGLKQKAWILIICSVSALKWSNNQISILI